MIDPSQPIRIPRTAGEPPHFLLWTVDDVGPVGIGLFAGVMSGQTIVCLLLGLVGAYIYRRFRDGNPDGFLLHFLYWIGLPVTKTARSMPNPYIREFLP